MTVGDEHDTVFTSFKQFFSLLLSGPTQNPPGVCEFWGGLEQILTLLCTVLVASGGSTLWANKRGKKENQYHKNFSKYWWKMELLYTHGYAGGIDFYLIFFILFRDIEYITQTSQENWIPTLKMQIGGFHETGSNKELILWAAGWWKIKKYSFDDTHNSDFVHALCKLHRL